MCLKPRCALSLVAVCLSLSLTTAFSQTVQQVREKKVADDVQKMQTNDFWIYNDLAKAKQIATDAKKPMMIVFR